VLDSSLSSSGESIRVACDTVDGYYHRLSQLADGGVEASLVDRCDAGVGRIVSESVAVSGRIFAFGSELEQDATGPIGRVSGSGQRALCVENFAAQQKMLGCGADVVQMWCKQLLTD